MSESAEVEPHFASLEQQAHAAKLGMWVFLASEALLFAGLFALYTTYRLHYPDGFREGIEHNTKLLGSINTGVLLVSSTLVASSVHLLRAGKRAASFFLVLATMALGGVFLFIKITEYLHHFDEGIYPGGVGRFFAEHSTTGLATFWTLYYLTTGLHAVHVTVGILLLSTVAFGIARGKIREPMTHRLEIGAIYWHLVDLIWIFVWPLYYLS